MTVGCTSTAGVGGPSLAFSGTATGAPNLASGTYTIACRVRWDTTNTTQDHFAVALAVSTVDGSGFYIQRVGSETSTQISAYRTNTAGTTIQEAIIASAYGSTTAWHHVCATYDGTTIRTYLDGVASGTIASATGTCTNATAGYMQLCGPATGTFADACFFKRALSAAEVLALSDQRFPMLLAHGDCFGWYPMLGDTLTVAGTDFSNSGNNAAIVNSGTGNPAITNVPVPAAWAQGAILLPRSINRALTAAGSTQTTGAAAESVAFPAVGTTQTTGAVTVSPQAHAVGTTQTTGGGAVVPQLLAVGTTQTTGAADAPNALTISVTSRALVGGWAFIGASATGQKLFWQGSSAGDFYQIAVDGTTLTYELRSLSDGTHYLFQTTISLNTWFHVAFEKSASVCYSFLNGVMVDSASTTFTSFSPPGELQIHKNLSAGSGMRHLFISPSGTGGDAQAISSIQNSFGYAYVRQDWFGLSLWPLLPGGGRLVGTSFGGTILTLSVWGSVPELDSNPPSNFSGQAALFFKSAVTALAAVGTTQTTGSAAVTAQLLAAGTTNTTGSAAVTAQLTAVGTTQTTGAAVVANVLKAAGTTQTTGAAAVAAVLLASGTTQTTGSAAVVAVLTAGGTTQTTGATSMTANGSSSIVPTGTTQTTGAVVIGITQPMAAAGSTQTTGAVVMGITFAMTASGSIQTTGAVVMTQGVPGGLTLGQKNAISRRSSAFGGLRRSLR